VESPRTLIQTAADPPTATDGDGVGHRILAGARGGPPVSADQLLLGRYRLIERLGAGGFGEVWRARDELLHREVAVKRIPLGPERDSERATREAHAAARLSHPAIVALYEALAVGDAFYLITELVDGDTLAELIRADALDDEEILQVGLALSAALSHAHARGVIHRDLKPQNVLVPDHVDDVAGAAKLTDFGGASLAGEQALTRTGDVLGTLAYMAPEQSEGREAQAEADLYALALILYEALSGVHPVRGATPAATARRIGRRVEPLERHRRDLPPALTRAIDQALEIEPRRRGTLDQLRAELRGAVEPGALRGRRTAADARSPAAEGIVALDALDPPPTPPRENAARILPATDAAGPRQQRPANDAEAEPALEPAPGRRTRSGAVPRKLWLAGALAVVVWQALAGRPGVALLAAAALLPLLALPRRSGPGPLACTLSPALGVIGLAGAFPAIAGQPRRLRERAALGALGYWWLLLAEPLLGTRLWLGPHPGTPARAVWEGSLSSSAVHVVGPLLGLGALCGALLWAGAAVVLPWIVRGRSAALDIVAATMWSAAIAAAAPRLDSGLAAGAAHASPRGAVLGAILGGMLAVAARALRGPV
jgi:hypothetical protein